MLYKHQTLQKERRQKKFTKLLDPKQIKGIKHRISLTRPHCLGRSSALTDETFFHIIH